MLSVVGSVLVLLLAFLAPATPSPVAGADIDPAAFLGDAVEETVASETLHFTVHNVRGETAIFPGVRLIGIEGDLQLPDRFQATLLAEAFIADVTIEMIGIGDRFWWVNPLTGDGEFQEEPIDPNLLALARPDTIVRLIPLLVVDPAFAGQDNLDGVRTTVVTGALDLTRLEEVAPDAPNSAVNKDQVLSVRVWVDDDILIRQIQIDGPFFIYDDRDVIRLIQLSNFNGPLAIEPPV